VIGMARIEIYCSNFCIYCTMAVQLLDRKGLDYDKRLVDRDPELRAEMEQRSQRTSVPQIFIGDRHIGGCDDLMALDRGGQLDALLGT
jgi:glutaredoxin 3